MIQQQVGDLLEVEEGHKYVYVVVLTKVVMFGGNILFAFHTDGSRRDVRALTPSSSGFNICADLLLPKREGRLERLHRFEDVAGFWRTRFTKYTHEHRLGVKAKEWFIRDIHDLNGPDVARVAQLSQEYREAMDSGCHSFDLVAEKAWGGYTPDRNAHL